MQHCPAWSLQEISCSHSQLLDFIWIPGCCCLLSLNQVLPSPSPALPAAKEQKPWQHQYKLPTNQKGVKYEQASISGVDMLSWPLEVPSFTEYGPSWPNQAEPGFPPKGTAFPIALLVPTPAWASVCSDWPQKQHPHDKMHSSLCTPAGTTQLCMCSRTPNTSPVLSVDVLHSSPLHYWAEILKEKDSYRILHSYRKAWTARITSLGHFTRPRKKNSPHLQRSEMWS